MAFHSSLCQNIPQDRCRSLMPKMCNMFLLEERSPRVQWESLRENLKLPRTVPLRLAKGPDVILQVGDGDEVAEGQEEVTSKVASGARWGWCPWEMSCRDSGTFSTQKGGQWSATAKLEQWKQKSVIRRIHPSSGHVAAVCYVGKPRAFPHEAAERGACCSIPHNTVVGIHGYQMLRYYPLSCG